MATDPTKQSNHVAPASMAFQIKPLGGGQQYLNMIIYGAFGTGKTTLAGTAADVDQMSDVLMIDIESGKLTLEESDRIEHKERIDTIRVTSFKQMAKVHEFLKAHCRYRDNPADLAKLKELQSRFTGVPVEQIAEPRRYRTVIIDSLSELDQLTLYELLGIGSDAKLDDVLKDGDMEVADWPVFRKNNQMLQLIIRAYRDLEINAIFCCHSSYTQDEKKVFHYSPQLTGQLKNQAQGFVDIVGYLIVGNMPEGGKEAPRRIYIQPVGKFDAKNRKGAFKESYLDNPKMADFWRLSGKK